MGAWQKVKLSDFLKPYRIEHIIQNDQEYKQVTISKTGEISLRGVKSGAKIGRKRQFKIDLNTYPNTVLFTRQGLMEGAIGLAPLAVNQCVVTENMPMMSVNTDIISTEIIKKLFLSSYFLNKVKQLKVVGSAQKSIHERDLLKIEVYLPKKDRQVSLSKKFVSFDIFWGELKNQLNYQQTLIKKLRQQILQEAIEGKLTAAWRDAQNNSPPFQGGESRSDGGYQGECRDTISNSPPFQGGVPRSGEGVIKMNNLPHLKTFRKKLRKNLTPAEAALWTLLKGKQLDGRKFRRQHSVANYILDFYCPSECLAIELDGQAHDSEQSALHDKERDIFLAHTGIKVLRFENKHIWENAEAILEIIKKEFNKFKPHRPYGTPPLIQGEEFNSSPPFQGGVVRSGKGVEPASQLLEKIRAEKAKLIKSGKLKKQKPLPPINTDETPFPLPPGWEWCRLGDVIFYTENLDIQKKLSPETKINYVDIDCIDNSNQLIREIKVRQVSQLSTRARRVLKQGFIIYSTVRPYLKNIAIINDELPLMIGSTGFNVFKPILIDKKFIFYFLLTPNLNKSYEEKMVGFNSPSITNKQFEKTLLPLPPLAEQKAIVAKVEKLLNTCDQLQSQTKQNQESSNALMQSVLHEAFTPT